MARIGLCDPACGFGGDRDQTEAVRNYGHGCFAFEPEDESGDCVMWVCVSGLGVVPNSLSVKLEWRSVTPATAASEIAARYVELVAASLPRWIDA